MNDEHDKEMLDENTSTFQGQRVSLMNFQSSIKLQQKKKT